MFVVEDAGPYTTASAQHFHSYCHDMVYFERAFRSTTRAFRQKVSISLAGLPQTAGSVNIIPRTAI